MHHLATKRTGKKRIKEKANVDFLRHRKLRVHRFIMHYLLFENLRKSKSQTLLITLEWTEFGCVLKI